MEQAILSVYYSGFFNFITGGLGIFLLIFLRKKEENLRFLFALQAAAMIFRFATPEICFQNQKDFLDLTRKSSGLGGVFLFWGVRILIAQFLLTFIFSLLTFLIAKKIIKNKTVTEKIIPAAFTICSISFIFCLAIFFSGTFIIRDTKLMVMALLLLTSQSANFLYIATLQNIGCTKSYRFLIVIAYIVYILMTLSLIRNMPLQSFVYLSRFPKTWFVLSGFLMILIITALYIYYEYKARFLNFLKNDSVKKARVSAGAKS